jgi:hypothetical protein
MHADYTETLGWSTCTRASPETRYVPRFTGVRRPARRSWRLRPADRRVSALRRRLAHATAPAAGRPRRGAPSRASMHPTVRARCTIVSGARGVWEALEFVLSSAPPETDFTQGRFGALMGARNHDGSRCVELHHIASVMVASGCIHGPVAQHRFLSPMGDGAIWDPRRNCPQICGDCERGLDPAGAILPEAPSTPRISSESLAAAGCKKKTCTGTGRFDLV